ncbi:hypothetical protein B5K06_29400 [Rhizobium grahamii]|uniref:Uncharacterized protein n=1 Tax=Rhizobium grahamii TaxID=1120045 RepID=A0A370KFX3_9HYPH|nr:hypothetical protein B5K06_29400 [Rhizobium grahamii]
MLSGDRHVHRDHGRALVSNMHKCLCVSMNITFDKRLLAPLTWIGPGGRVSPSAPHVHLYIGGLELQKAKLQFSGVAARDNSLPRIMPAGLAGFSEARH